jgi:hypothetical protein
MKSVPGARLSKVGRTASYHGRVQSISSNILAYSIFQ